MVLVVILEDGRPPDVTWRINVSYERIFRACTLAAGYCIPALVALLSLAAVSFLRICTSVFRPALMRNMVAASPTSSIELIWVRVRMTGVYQHQWNLTRKS